MLYKPWQGVGVCSLMLTRVHQSPVRARALVEFLFYFYYLFVGLMQIIIILNWASMMCALWCVRARVVLIVPSWALSIWVM